MKLSKRTICKTTLCTTAVLLTACSSTQYSPDPSDPLQGMNRVTYSFNQKFDKYALKPAAQAYTFVTPQFARDRVTNFFSNIGEVPTFFNDTLQGNLKLSATALGRFVVNTTIGLLGLFDPASSMGMTKHYNDFGITLAQYGVTTSPYLVLPLIGPSSIRDALALWPNYAYMSVWGYVGKYNEWRNIFFVIDIVNLRASMLSSEDVVRQASLDEYVFIRNAYLQKRASLIKNYTGRDVGPKGQSNTDDDPLDNMGDLSKDSGASPADTKDATKGQSNTNADPLDDMNDLSKDSGTSPAATKGNVKNSTTSTSNEGPLANIDDVPNNSDASPTATKGTTKSTTANTTSPVTKEDNNVTAPPPVSFRQQSNDPVKQSLAQNELVEMDS